MGLRDRIESQRDLEKKQIDQQKAYNESIKNLEIQKQNAAYNQKRSELASIQELLAKGEVPEEWSKIYDKYVAELEKALENSKLDYFNKFFSVDESFYKEYYFPNGDKKCTGDYLNDYLAERFKGEGFYNSVFRLEKCDVPYSTDQDRKQYDADMQEYSRKMAEYNEREIARQVSANLGENGISFDRPPKYPTMKQSGIDHTFGFRMMGEFTLGALKRAGVKVKQKNNKKIDVKKLLKILGISLAFLPAVIVLGAAIYFIFV